jgi:hypothetical protein
MNSSYHATLSLYAAAAATVLWVLASRVVSSSVCVNPQGPQVVWNLHLRKPDTAINYALHALVDYDTTTEEPMLDMSGLSYTHKYS